MKAIELSDPKDITTIAECCYFHPDYLKNQSHHELIVYEGNSFLIPFTIKNNRAFSIDKCPFGSFFITQNSSKIAFGDFEKEVFDSLKKKGITEMFIRHPAEIYPDFVMSSELSKAGYNLLYNDINQHISLNNDWEDSLHKMQCRKLKSLAHEGFEFKAVPHSEVKLMHQFLTLCRQAQGLEINISLEKLKNLIQDLPQAYDFFGVFRDNKMSAACISVRVNDSIAYYYLAGTSPLFRSQSPMVLLISGMVDYYRSRGFKILDLGVSSFEGKPQPTLQLFKERMGGVQSLKPTFTKKF